MENGFIGKKPRRLSNNMDHIVPQPKIETKEMVRETPEINMDHIVPSKDILDNERHESRPKKKE